MIPDREESAHSLVGAWRLFRGDPRGMAEFDLSVEGFWRSFGAVVLLLPLYALAVLPDRQALISQLPPDTELDDLRFFLVRLLSLAIDWVALPILLAALARPLGVSGRYAGYIVARNWASVLLAIPGAVIGAAFSVGIVDGNAALILSLVVFVVVLRCLYLIARLALGVPTLFALALVAADTLLSLVIGGGLDALFFGGA